MQDPLEYDSIEGLENIDKVVNVDQSPLGRTPRSNPATYTGVFDMIRDLLRQLRMQRHVDIRRDVSVSTSKADAVRPAVEMVS